jgi:hypothetical protein
MEESVNGGWSAMRSERLSDRRLSEESVNGVLLVEVI